MPLCSIKADVNGWLPQEDTLFKKPLPNAAAAATAAAEAGEGLRPQQDFSISCLMLRQFPGKFPQMLTGCLGGTGLERQENRS